MTDTQGAQKIAELIKGQGIAMLTHIDADGRLVSQPMATQDVDFDGDVWFIGERSSQKIADLQLNNKVNVAYTERGKWVSLAGTAEVVDDIEKLRENWDRFTDAWLEGGPENPNNILIHVAAESAEYWTAEGGPVTQVANLIKSRVTGDRIEGESGVVDL